MNTIQQLNRLNWSRVNKNEFRILRKTDNLEIQVCPQKAATTAGQRQPAPTEEPRHDGQVLTALSPVGHMLPMGYMCTQCSSPRLWWNWHALPTTDVFTKCWWTCTNPPIFLSQPPVPLKPAFERGPAEMRTEVLLWNLATRKPDVFTVWVCPQLQIHQHHALTSKSSCAWHKHNVNIPIANDH